MNEQNFTDLEDDIEVKVTTAASKELLSITMAELFTVEECDEIKNTVVDELWMKIKVVGDQKLHKCLRQKLRGELTGFPFNPVRSITKEANEKIFDFNLLGIIDQDYPQIFRYQTGDYYDWHVELNPLAPTRKLSFIINLSSPDEYTGGAIEFLNTTVTNDIFNKKGTIFIFPSFLPYKINSVKSGTMDLIIGHIHGPVFR
jgi:predicted 2-oxoglutarate/Fe(II)-dependent dioxygenase YbiX